MRATAEICRWAARPLLTTRPFVSRGYLTTVHITTPVLGSTPSQLELAGQHWPKQSIFGAAQLLHTPSTQLPVQQASLVVHDEFVPLHMHLLSVPQAPEQQSVPVWQSPRKGRQTWMMTWQVPWLQVP